MPSERRWIILAQDGRHVTMGRAAPPSEAEDAKGWRSHLGRHADLAVAEDAVARADRICRMRPPRTAAVRSAATPT